MTIPAASGGQAKGMAVPGAMRWDGAVNAWHVAGDVYRMGRREWLTETGWRQAYDRGIRTVVDLRNEAEIRRRETDPPVSAAALAAFDVVLAPTEDPGQQRIPGTLPPYLNDPASYADNARLFPHLLAGVFKAVAAAEGGVIIHCSAGRDRSGMIAAMLQDLAGESDEAIVRGYERSMRGINEHHRRSAVPHPHERFLPENVLDAPAGIPEQKACCDSFGPVNTADFLPPHGMTARELDGHPGQARQIG